MERSTRQRTAIRSAIDLAGRPLSPQEILEKANKEVSSLGMATIYRNLKLLVDEGVIQLVHLPNANPLYESVHPEHAHHHHFQCKICQRVFDIHACVESIEQLAPQGFAVEHHELTLYGTCAECASSAL